MFVYHIFWFLNFFLEVAEGRGGVRRREGGGGENVYSTKT